MWSVIFHIPSWALWWNKNLSCILTEVSFIAYSIWTTQYSYFSTFSVIIHMSSSHLLDELIVSVPDYQDSMNESISDSISDSLTQNSSQSSSHCWEEDGSFHSVCIFVLAVSGVCSLATFITVYRVIQMIIAAIRYIQIYYEILHWKGELITIFKNHLKKYSKIDLFFIITFPLK